MKQLLGKESFQGVEKIETEQGHEHIEQLLKQAGLVNSTSDAIRMIIAGAVRMDGERLTNPKQVIVSTDSHVYQVGKRKFARVVINCKKS